jgi:hypothetical protein
MDTPSESGWSATLPVNAYSAMAMRPWNSLRNKRRVRYQTFFAKIVGPPPNLQDDFGTYEHRANQADGPGLTAPNRPFNLRVERRGEPGWRRSLHWAGTFKLAKGWRDAQTPSVEPRDAPLFFSFK